MNRSRTDGLSAPLPPGSILGVIGGGVVDHLATLDDWKATSVSRRPDPDARADQHLALDLLDADAVGELLGKD